MSCACSVRNQFELDKGRLSKALLRNCDRRVICDHYFYMFLIFISKLFVNKWDFLILFFILSLENKLFAKS